MRFIVDAIRECSENDEDWLDMLHHLHLVTHWYELQEIITAEAHDRGCCPVCLIEGRGLVPVDEGGHCARCKAAADAWRNAHRRKAKPMEEAV